MSDTPFTKELVQVVSDWQRKARDRKRRHKKAMALQEECLKLPLDFRQTSLACYRQMALDKSGVWKLLGEQALDEQISSWTQDMAVAKNLLGGVPEADTGFTAVIFAIHPKSEQVVVNLKKLLDDENFKQAVEAHKANIAYYHDGLGKYRNDQSEVVLNVGEFNESDVWTLGGRSNSFDELVARAFVVMHGRKPNDAEFANFRAGVKEIENQAGARWLEHEGTRRVLNRIRPQAEVLREIQRQRNVLLEAAKGDINQASD